MSSNAKITREEIAVKLFMMDLVEGNWEFGTKFETIPQEEKENYLRAAAHIQRNAIAEGYPEFLQEYIDQKDTDHNPYRKKNAEEKRD